MHISFIHAPLGGDFTDWDIAITSLATFINKTTLHRASIIDLTFHRRRWREHLRDRLGALKPDVVGVTTNTMYMKYTREVLKEVKKIRPVPVLLGGHHASIKPEEGIKIDECDAVFIGDGELPLPRYLDILEKGGSFQGLDGVWVKENGRVTKNSRGCFYEDLNSLPPPDWDLWEDRDKYFYYIGMIYAIGSRGCPYRCTFCDAHGIAKAVAGRYFRKKDPSLYVAELVYQYKKYGNLGIRCAQLFDSVFTFDNDWLNAFCDYYRSLGMHEKLPLSVFSRVDHLSEEKIRTLSKSGLKILRVGIETGNERIRNEVYNKKISNEVITEMYRIAHENGIIFTTYFILGGPSETRETLNETISFAKELKSERNVFFVFKPFTDEALNLVAEYGGMIDKARWEDSDNLLTRAVIRSGKLTARAVEITQYRAYLETLSARIYKLVRKKGISYFSELFEYMSRGIRDGLDPLYLLAYFHVFGYNALE